MNSNPKHMKILERLLKLPENKECADCKSKAPRWASINLGIFICLQCSGIHRSLGVHISKVRSATLDSWLPEQVAFMQSMGNKKSNAYWEAELSPHYDRGQIESFIHAKYVEKRWIPKGCKDKSALDSKPQLLSSRSSRRYGSIAEWTNSQHQCKERRDFVVGEKDRAGSSPVIGKVPKDNADNKDQHQKKQERSTPSLDQRANSGSISVNNKPSIEPTQVVRTSGANGSLQKSEEVRKTKTTTANAMPSVPSAKVDYADLLFRTLYTDNSADNDSSPIMNDWVRFDSDQEPSTSGAKIVPKTNVGEAIMGKGRLPPKPAASSVKPATKMENNQTVLVPFTTGDYSEHQKYVLNNKQSLSEKPMMVSTSSMHLQKPAVPAQGVSATVTPKLLKSRTTGSQISMQNFQPGKSALNSASYNMSRSVNPSKGISAPPARGSSATLPVSGYNYDFSFLTQDMLKRR